MTWNPETFALADSWDERKGAYLGLRAGQAVRVSTDSTVILVKPEVAAAQLDRERNPERPPLEPGEGDPGCPVSPIPPRPEPPPRVLRRFHGSVALDPARLGRDAGRIAEEVVQHLTTLKSARVRLTLEIEADLPDGAPDNVVRVVTENARTLKFGSQGFEEE